MTRNIICPRLGRAREAVPMASGKSWFADPWRSFANPQRDWGFCSQNFGRIWSNSASSKRGAPSSDGSDAATPRPFRRSAALWWKIIGWGRTRLWRSARLRH